MCLEAVVLQNAFKNRDVDSVIAVSFNLEVSFGMVVFQGLAADAC